MLMPLAAVIAILLGWQQQRLAHARRDSLDTHRAMLTMEAAFAHVPVGLAVLDLDLRYVRINRLLAEINGLPVEDHIGKSIYDVIPEIAPTAELRTRQVMATRIASLGAVFEGATPALPHLRRVWRESIYPVIDRNDALLGVTVVVEEITEQQRLAGALQDSQRREQRRTSELEGLMQAAPAALFVASDRECRRVKANPAAERLLRLRRGENPVADDRGGRSFSVYEGNRQLALDQLPLQRAATGEVVRDATLTLRFADDDRLHVVINALPLRDEAGEVVGAVAGFVEAPPAAAKAEIGG
jgi:PAS domain S-box-containing protein